jgi:serine/threonine protein kinase
MVSARAWVIDALEALGHAHRNHIIHKDVRAANLLLDEAGNALLSNFGISDDALRQARITPKAQEPRYGSPSTCRR